MAGFYQPIIIPSLQRQDLALAMGLPATLIHWLMDDQRFEDICSVYLGQLQWFIMFVNLKKKNDFGTITP